MKYVYECRALAYHTQSGGRNIDYYYYVGIDKKAYEENKLNVRIPQYTANYNFQQGHKGKYLKDWIA